MSNLLIDVMKKVKRIKIAQYARKVILMVIFLSSSLLSTEKVYKITGHVYDKDAAAIPYANVFLKGSLIGDMTDEHGFFSFSAASTLFDTLVCRHIGYEEFCTPIPFQTESPSYMSIILREKSLQSRPIYITASSYSSGDEGQVTLSSLDIVKTPGAAADVMWAIQTFPGVQQVEDGAGLFVRGGDVNETAVVLDGAYLFHPYKFESPNGGFFGMISPFLLSGTFFSTGGYGVEYGNALSGVLAMSSHLIPDVRKISLGAGVANQAIGIEMPIIQSTLGMSASANYSNSTLLFQMNRHNHEFSQYPVSWDINLNTVWRYSQQGYVKLFLFHERDNIGVSVIEPGRTEFYSGDNSSVLYNVHWNHTLSPKWLFKGNLAYSGFFKSDDFITLDLKTRHHLYQTRVAAEYFSSPVHILSGLDYFQHHENVTGTIPVQGDQADGVLFPVDVRYFSKRLALYHQWRIQAGDKLQSQTGLRFETDTKSGDRFVDWRQSFVFKVKPAIDLVLSVGRYHQFPQPDRYDVVVGNPALSSFKAWHYILGLFYQKRETLFRVEGFYKDYHDLLLQDPMVNYTNDGYGHAKGIDIFLKSAWRALSGRISLSLLESKRKWMDAPYLVATRFDIAVNATPVLEYTFAPTWSIALKYRFATGKPYSSSPGTYHDERVPTYHRTDVAVNHFFALFPGNFSVIYLAVNNLFDRDNIMDYRYSEDYVERVAVKSTIRRTFYLGVQTSI
ncbi:TonB-dependent receptor [candidate division KSB1 bacterium]|nr:TonB-dependent receptor [candidate division KSB1 bacterium]RQW01833.1 MAG: TonB-dependent receptor [candidate division KSB1 bacterium]